MIKSMSRKRQKGVTLVELIVTMVLLGIVMTMSYSLMNFGMRTFNRGERQADVQFDVRMASDFISREVRYASSLEILPAGTSIPGTITGPDSYLYVDVEEGTHYIISRDKDGTRRFKLGAEADIYFDTISPYQTLNFRITGVANANPYNIESDIFVQNLGAQGSIQDSADEDGAVLRFNKGELHDVPDELRMTGTVLPNAYAFSGYSFQFTVTEGTAPYTYAFLSGDFPPGLTLFSNGKLSGTPSQAGVYAFTVGVTDSSERPLVSAYSYTLVVEDTPENMLNKLLIQQPATNETIFTMPSVPTGIQLMIVSSGNEEILTENGEIIPPEIDTEVEFVLRLIRSDGMYAEKAFTVMIPQAYTGNQAPVASGILITGTTVVGHTLTGFYVYSDAEGDLQGQSIFQWYRSNTMDGFNMQPIIGANGITYPLTSTDKDRYVFFSVQPVALAGAKYGQLLLSSPSFQIASSSATITDPPTVSDVHVVIRGSNAKKARVGEILDGKYTFHHIDGTATDRSDFKWYRSDFSGGVDMTEIQGATGKSYTIAEEDKGKFIYFEVTPRAISSIHAGTSVRSSNLEVHHK